MPNRSRAAIQQEIDALTAELAATQPDEIVVRSIAGESRPLSLEVATGYPGAVCLRGNMMGNVYAADTLRDFLNYHFPKETI